MTICACSNRANFIDPNAYELLDRPGTYRFVNGETIGLTYTNTVGETVSLTNAWVSFDRTGKLSITAPSHLFHDILISVKKEPFKRPKKHKLFRTGKSGMSIPRLDIWS